MELNSLNNINIERSILSTIMFNSEIMEELEFTLKSEMFFYPPHQRIYTTIEHLNKNNKPISDDFIFSYYKKTFSTHMDDKDAMLEILSTNPLPATKEYVKELLEMYQRRKLIILQGELNKKVMDNENIEEIKLWINQSIDNINGGMDTKAKSFSEWKKEILAMPTVEPIKTGIGFIDQPLSLVKNEDFDLTRDGGFELGRFILLMGDPEAGKTMLGIQMMKHISKHVPVVFFAFEFTVRNFIRTQMRIEGNNYENKNLQIIDDGYDISDIIKELHFWSKKGCHFALIDSQMRVTNSAKKRATSEEVETEKFSILAKTAQKLDMVIVYICQQGKEDARGGVVSPMGSKKGGHEADIILYLKKDKANEDRNLIFNKNKQTGKHFIKDITFSRKEMIFKSIKNKYEKGKGDKPPLSDVESSPLEKITICYPNGTRQNTKTN